VALGTDAEVPRFGDRVLAQVVDTDGNLACPSCERVIGLSTATEWPLTFGIAAPRQHSPLRIRARLYRSVVTGADGRPNGSAAIDVVGRLPEASEVTRVALAIPLVCFGSSADLVTGVSCAPDGHTGPDTTLLAGDSGAALPKPGAFGTIVACKTAAPEGMRCVPGGVFLLGDARPSWPIEVAPVPERLVRLSPFYLDEDEVRVAQVRQLIAQGLLTLAPQTPTSKGTPFESCTFLGANLATNDALPVSCVPRTLAAEACAALGKRIPTEAEWEWAAGNADEESLYPWGDAQPTCDMLVAGRARFAGEGFALPGGSTSCRSTGVLLAGPSASAPTADTTKQGIKNLGGNLQEWTADAFASYDSECWQGPTPLPDPQCQAGDGVSVRGSAWDQPLFRARSSARGPVPNGTGASGDLGFRCARNAK
jgi:formylglycine-generating enzyme required for sulfatase activity